MNEFRYIKNRNDLARFLNIPKNKLTYVLYIKKVENQYNTFEISKKNGEVRVINTPQKDLKEIQRKLTDVLWRTQKEIYEKDSIKPTLSHAFEKNKSIITNARVHRNKRFVLNIDLENFFDSFHFGRVKGFFEKNKNFKFSTEVATIIAQLTCYDGKLPQGAPSSPIISNLICQILDIRLWKVARKYKLDYSRYADDLTFSTNDRFFLSKQSVLYEELSTEIKRAGFKINNKKTRLQFQNARQEVTGLIVNKKINIKREYYKATRAMAYNLYKHGNFKINESNGTLRQLEGRFSFINQIDIYNNKLNSEKHDFRNLNYREKEYQKFLFYKYFYGNKKPLLITEGKTDIRYLKAALKNLHLEFPELIEKKSDGKFYFKISFFKRSKRLKYFMNLSLDGADTLKSIYNFYCGKDNYPNYYKYFNEVIQISPNNPIFLILDNELSNPNKPICKFLNFTHKKNSLADLKETLSLKLIDNLYLLTNPIFGEKAECEIEDLFDVHTLSHKINGKEFSRMAKTNCEDTYGKEIFSKYIYDNYKNINFDNFRPMLEELNNIVKLYSDKENDISTIKAPSYS